jgi:hypothetical protein
VIDAAAIRELRKLASRRMDAPAAVEKAARTGEEFCDLCSVPIPADHRHMLQVEERQIVCACETCRAIYGGDGPYRPTGSRTVWLGGLELPDELWASFRIPIGLAFFFRSSTSGGIVAFYPSPAGTTECELELGTWDELVAANPILAGLETDAEALIVNRLDEARQYAIVPIDECYRLVGVVRVNWEGISGGVHIASAVTAFFDRIERAA